ncbi:MAG: sensor histidine kinase, partial [Pseudomonadota bacterium]
DRSRRTPDSATFPPDTHVLARTWQPLRGPFERWPNLTDFLLALLSFMLTLSMWSIGETDFRLETLVDIGTLLCAFVGNFALLWRRSHPVQVHTTVLVASLLVHLGPVTDGVFALTFSLYSLGRYAANDRASLLGMLAALAFVSMDLLLSEPDIGGVIAAGFVMLLWYVGRRLRFRGEYLRLLEERARHLEREQNVEAERAVATERTRIARELHDIVAHQVSLMTVQAGAARTVAEADPKAAAQAMSAVEKAGRQALAEMRHLLSVLRPGRTGDELGPQPGVADLNRLVEEVSEAGPVVRLTTEGALSDLPPRLDLTIYRIVQEALTNVLKHAGPAPRVNVMVRSSDEWIELYVRDNGQGSALPGKGHGIAGMRERAELLGGTLTADEHSQGGYVVKAVLPRRGNV